MCADLPARPSDVFGFRRRTYSANSAESKVLCHLALLAHLDPDRLRQAAAHDGIDILMGFVASGFASVRTPWGQADGPTPPGLGDSHAKINVGRIPELLGALLDQNPQANAPPPPFPGLFPDKLSALIKDAELAAVGARIKQSNAEKNLLPPGTHIPSFSDLAPVVLLASLGKPGMFNTPVYELLFLLSIHRDITTETTVWRKAGVAPTIELTLELLAKVRAIDLPITPGAVVSMSILSMIRILAGRLDDPACAPLLASDTYRALLWDSIDTVIWRKVVRSGYETLLPDRQFPVRADKASLLQDLWLVAEFGYVVLGVNRGLHVHAHFGKAMRHELLLYHGGDAYRDHLHHVLHTFLLGFVLLTAKGSPLRGVVQLAGEQWNDDQKKQLRNWFVGALFHDFGYVMDLVPTVHRLASQFDSKSVQDIIKAMTGCWEEQVGKFNTAVAAENGILSELKQRPDHGLFGYSQLRRLLLSLDQGPLPAPEKLTPAGSPACREYGQALRAVMLHNLAREPVSFANDPIAATLILCDEIQDWRRPRYDSVELLESSSSLIHFQEAKPITARQICDTLRIEPNPAANGGLEFKAPGVFAPPAVPTVILRYADQNLNMFDPLERLLSGIYNIERIQDASKAKFAIEIWIRPLLAPADDEVSEIDILREFCLLREHGCISPELYTEIPRRELHALHARRCAFYRTISNSYTYDVIRLNLPSFPDTPRKNPLVACPAWDPRLETELQEFKYAYCRKRGIRCAALDGDDGWPERQILPNAT